MSPRLRASGTRGLLRAATRSKTTIVVFVTMWAIGLAALAAVIRLQADAKSENQAQIVAQTLQRQVGDLTVIAFSPVLSVPGFRPTPAQSRYRLGAAESQLGGSLSMLSRLGGAADAAVIEQRLNTYLPALNALANGVSHGTTTQAAIEFGQLSKPGGSYTRLISSLQEASTDFGAQASRMRGLELTSEVAALVIMLAAFSISLLLSTRLTREKHRLLTRSQVEALTDALTGLPNRRALFLDMETLLAGSPRAGELALAMLDLDGFKNYNDTFGHPAGDALLARLGQRLAAQMSGHGSAYRMGGDEFCVIARGSDPERVLAAAALALGESGEGYAVSCSLGSVLISPEEMTVEQALQHADQRLYDNKRLSLARGDGEAHDVLLRILAENSLTLAAHLTTVGRLAEAVARKLGLSEEEVTLTRLTAELHDIGKTAIPDEILHKPGPLDDDEWAFMRRHTIIGERILAAAPALAAVAPLVRSSHERPDGTGYPDGLSLDEIPVSSRIVAVVDAYDAMTSIRPYCLPRTPRQAIEELRRCEGSQFDGSVAEAFISVWEECLEARPAHDPTDLPKLAA